MQQLDAVVVSLLGGLEAGGTKMVCGVRRPGERSLMTTRIETEDVEGTIGQIVSFFEQVQGDIGPLDAIGIACFGPLDLDPGSPTYGQLLATPKPGWQGVDLPARLRAALGLPTRIDTDVNAAALAEVDHGAARGCRSAAYVTVGTGVGVGLVVDGHTLKGLGHPEAGHLLPRRHSADQNFAGTCPFHGDCLEGLASGPAISAAWGGPLSQFPADHTAWAVEADYLGQLCLTLILTMAPEHIVLGGGVMSDAKLLDLVRRATQQKLGGYAAAWNEASTFATRMTGPECPEPSGLEGAYLLAAQACAAAEKAI